MTERQKLKQAIEHLESQRAVLGDATVDASIAALRDRLAALELLTVAEQQRKQVTILFADVSGFTAMSETMDAEDVTSLINALWQRLDQVIADRGGQIDKHMGDAVMAIWGGDVAQEDDPEQAIRAALDMQSEIAGLNEARSTVPLQIRVGINTGLVLLGEVGTQGEYTAIGDAVNLARRLQEMASVGGILISHDTYRHVRGVFDVRSLGLLQLKGRAESVQAYAIERAKPRSFRKGARGVEGVETRMIGREAELEFLQDLFDRAMEREECQIVTVLGEAGLGKSRLLYEFENWLDLLPRRIRYFRGRAMQEMQHLPYALVRDILAFRLLIQDSDPTPVVRQKIAEGIGEILGHGPAGQIKAHLIGQLLGFDFGDSPHVRGALDDPRSFRDRAMAYLGEFFQRTAAAHQAVILLEDLHWADHSSLDLLGQLMTVMRGRPLLVVCTARPAFQGRRPQWGQGQALYHHLELRPLSAQESGQLLEEILQRVVGVPAALRDLVVGQAEGNPFYVEELVKMLIEEGVVVKTANRWYVEPARLAVARVPSTLTGVLQARLDSLPAAEQEVLQQAAVVGRTFWDGAIARIQEEAGRQSGAFTEQSGPDIDHILAALQDRELIFARGSSAFAGTTEYIFKHAILRQVTYERVLKRLRRGYHAIVAEWLMGQSGERADEYTGLVADHLEWAGQVEQACTYLRQAGEQAAARFANAEALDYLGRALALVAESNLEEHYALLLAREGIWALQGEREAQDRDLQSLQVLVEALDDDRRRAEVALRRADYAEASGDYAVTGIAARDAVALAQKAREPALEARGLLGWGRALSRQGDNEGSRLRFEQGLKLAQTARLPGLEADSRRCLGIVAYLQGDYARARSDFEEALRIKRELGDRLGEGALLNSLGAVASEQGDRARAVACFEEALSIRREAGNRMGEAEVLNNLGAMADERGDHPAARSYYQIALAIKREIGDRQGESATLNNLGSIADTLGDYAQARVYWEQALAIKQEVGDRRGEEIVLINLGLLAHHLGNDEAAQEFCRQALEIAQELGDRRMRGHALVHLGHALAGLGRTDEAVTAYQEALSVWQELGQQHITLDALAGLARAAFGQGDLERAQNLVEEILDVLEDDTLPSSDEPFRIYLTCYRVFSANQDPRGPELLRTAHTLLRKRADQIEDEELRQMFLERIVAHREIEELYKNVYRRFP